MSAINCPKCRLTMPIIRDLAGRPVSCPECGCRFTMPPPAPESVEDATVVRRVPTVSVSRSLLNRNVALAVCWSTVIAGGLAGAFYLVLGIFTGHPALSTIAIACALVPYVIVKAIDGILGSIEQLTK